MFDHLSSAELRLDLAEAVESKPRTIRDSIVRKDRIQALTQELVRRGSF